MPVDITATKPASQPGNPSWATNGGTRVAPTLGQKQTGWTNAQRPPFNVFNWLLGFLSDWAKYSEDATDQLDTKKLSVNGVNGMVGDLFPTVDNVVNNGSGANRWSHVFAYILDLTTKIKIGATDVLTETLFKLAATADVRTTARKNSITTLSMPKATALIRLVGGALVGTGGTVAGFNITSAALVSHAVQITLATAFADTNYIVVLSWNAAGAVVIADLLTYTINSTTVFTINNFALSTGTGNNIETNDKDISIAVYGLQ